MKTDTKAIKGKIEEVLRNRIAFIGNEIPDSFTTDKRDKQLYLGYPQQLIDELSELLASHNLELIEQIKELEKREDRLLKKAYDLRKVDIESSVAKHRWHNGRKGIVLEILALFSEDHSTENKSYFDLPENEKREIVEKAAQASVEDQRELVNKSWRPGDKEEGHDFVRCFGNHGNFCKTHGSHCSPYKGEICKHCGQPIKIRMLDPKCDHLYYPENCVICSKREIESE